MPFTRARTVALALSLFVVPMLTTPAAATVHKNPMLAESVQKIGRFSTSKWSGVLSRVWATQPLAERVCEQRLGGDCRLDQWQRFIEEHRGLARVRQIAQVQEYVNLNRYRSDAATWGKSDYWAAPGEFFARGGDCEDFAIAKYLSLKQLGFDPKDLRILVLRDTRRRLMHAVLLVQSGGETLVLDNNASRVLTWDEVPHYKPLYSVNEIDFWLHTSNAA